MTDQTVNLSELIEIISLPTDTLRKFKTHAKTPGKKGKGKRVVVEAFNEHQATIKAEVYVMRHFGYSEDEIELSEFEAIGHVSELYI
jgi:hypothetical protein